MATVISARRHTVTVDVVGDKALKALQAQAERLGSSVQRLNNVSRQSAAGLDRIGRSSSGLGRGLQNASFQVQDFFVQIASGTDATRALTQQLPQMLVGFGLLGAGIGAVVAIGGALAPVLSGIASEAGSASALLGSFAPVAEGLVSAFQTLKPVAVDALNAVINNLDRVLFIGSAVAVFFGTRMVAAFVAARISALSFAASLAAVRAALIRIGVGVVVVAFGELALRFSRLVEAAGGFGNALSLLADVGREAFERIALAGQALGSSLSAIWLTMSRGFYRAIETMRGYWADFLDLIAGGAGSLASATLPGGFTPFEGWDVPFKKAAGRARTSVEEVAATVESLTGEINDAWTAAGEFADAATRPLVSVERLRDLLAETKTETVDLRDVFEQLGATAEQSLGGGATDAVKELGKAAADTKRELGQIQQMVVGGVSGMFRDIVSGAKSAKDAFKGMLTEMALDIAEFIVRQQLTKFLIQLGSAMAGGLGGGLGGGGGGGGGGALWGPPAGTAASWNDDGLDPQPYYAMGSRAAHMVGSITPPTQASLRERGGAPIINIHNNAPVDVQAKQRTDSTGQRTMDISINQRMAQAISSGALDPVLNTTYGLTRRAR